MQVVARARAAGVVCRPRDIFVEQTVAGLARVAGVTDGGAAPSMRARAGGRDPDHALAGKRRWPGRRVQPDGAGAGSAGVTEADVVVLLQALLDRQPCCGCASTTTGPGAGR